jgi:murein DD-endopeptidase MepM/ murein hydrolase activator NlpD
MQKKASFLFISSDQTRVKQIKISRIQLLVYFSIFFLVMIILGKYSLDILIEFSQNSKIKNLKNENLVLRNQMKQMNTIISNINAQMAVIESKDDELRLLIGMQEINDDLREVGIGGVSFEYKLSEDISNADLTADLKNKFALISKLERETKLELKSYNELKETFLAKEDSLRYLPALNPIPGSKISSDYQMRLHPILKIRHMHPGIDLPARTGTPIHASADGVIQKVGNQKHYGLGKHVIINHRYGYETKYGHMQKIMVREGQKVKRGDIIGLVGTTGLSTAPHLHYEILFNGKNVDPKHYYFNDDLNELYVKHK